MTRLYVEGHNHRLGYIVSVELSDETPVRHYSDLRYARKVVERFNRIQKIREAR